LESQLVLEALGRVRQCGEQLKPFGEVANRFRLCRVLQGALAGPLPPGNSLLTEASLRVVMGKQLGLGLDYLLEMLRQFLRNLLVVLLSGALKE
jgi:hypothetical protein